MDMGVGKLKSLVKSFNAKDAIGLVEKCELVQAIMASSRFEEEHAESAVACAASTAASGGTSTITGMSLVARDLETALEASVLAHVRRLQSEHLGGARHDISRPQLEVQPHSLFSIRRALTLLTVLCKELAGSLE